MRQIARDMLADLPEAIGIAAGMLIFVACTYSLLFVLWGHA